MTRTSPRIPRRSPRRSRPTVRFSKTSLRSGSAVRARWSPLGLRLREPGLIASNRTLEALGYSFPLPASDLTERDFRAVPPYLFGREIGRLSLPLCAGFPAAVSRGFGARRAPRVVPWLQAAPRLAVSLLAARSAVAGSLLTVPLRRGRWLCLLVQHLFQRRLRRDLFRFCQPGGTLEDGVPW